ncbi:protein SRC2 homolog isoform X2 [Arabidopsis lyrata subsp. lyrata]|uniref:protein SRC2 homolog isoform X2 n=1 Tax=Arabidopsis lyrata subsp. lyrata TaxID=81972 RepID=UPI000A29D7EC|nr:protein SRC2 homolog isoform X2 [Arabidopsis lyrata subsp. lyrata]|eukprot:XP_020867126.1 protein SRC2 homolog isoform X2 [Arabidopsis lyrata subsp. lyrata]
MECRSLDLTIISAEDLKDIQLIGKQDLYAVVSINGDARTKQKTKVDKDCGTKPKWKHQMKLTVDDAAARENRLTLVFEIVADRPIAGDKPVGEVSVPVKELLDQNKGDEEKTVTYAVRLPNGKAKGSLKFSFKFGDKYTFGSSSAPHAPVPSSMDHKTMDQPVTAYPPGHGAPSAYPAPPAGPSSGYPPPGPGGYPPPGAYPQQGGYPGYPPPQQGGYPGYPPQGPYGYPQQGYPPQGPYGYPQQQAYGKPQKPKKHGKAGAGMGLGLGLGAGLLGGLLVGEAVSDIADMGDMGDMGGDFDF